MNFRVFAAALAGAVVIFVMGYAIWGALFASMMNEGVIQHPGLDKETPNFVALFSSNLALTCLVALIFEYWSKSRTLASRCSAEECIGEPPLRIGRWRQ